MTLQAQGRTHFGTAVDRMDSVSSVFGKPEHSSLPFDSFSLITLSHTLISSGCRPGHSRSFTLPYCPFPRPIQIQFNFISLKIVLRCFTEAETHR